MLTLYDEFAGVGGSTLGATRVPGVTPILAVNHWRVAVDSHAANFPDADHECADARALDMAALPRADIFWASPACPPWTDARGRKRDFDAQTVQQGVLFGQTPPDESTRRARALMEEIPRYLAAMACRGRPVLVGVVENVIQCRLWADWGRWIREIELLGYRTRVIAFNSMHAAAPRCRRAPQSRDRLYVAYWHTSLGRDPDWDTWLRPAAWCPTCAQTVPALQVFKKPRADMGRYRSQYIYRCPHRTCRHQVVEPAVLPALAAIDPTVPRHRDQGPAGPRLARPGDAGPDQGRDPPLLAAAAHPDRRHLARRGGPAAPADAQPHRHRIRRDRGAAAAGAGRGPARQARHLGDRAAPHPDRPQRNRSRPGAAAVPDPATRRRRPAPGPPGHRSAADGVRRRQPPRPGPAAAGHAQQQRRRRDDDPGHRAAAHPDHRWPPVPAVLGPAAAGAPTTAPSRRRCRPPARSGR